VRWTGGTYGHFEKVGLCDGQCVQVEQVGWVVRVTWLEIEGLVYEVISEAFDTRQTI
jgi:hypothetical protein